MISLNSCLVVELRLRKMSNDYQFHKGLMLALRVVGEKDHFVTEGRRFHEAFRLTTERTVDYENIPTVDPAFDPVFSVCLQADAFLLDGLERHVIELTTGNSQKAYFTLTRNHAERRLNTLSGANDYKELARYFLDQLEEQ